MIKVRIKYVVEDVDRHGNVRLYLRRPGFPKLRLPGPMGSDQFWLAYNDAFGGEVIAKPVARSKSAEDSFRLLCELYYGSAEFKLLEDRTRRVRRRVLDHFCEKYGDNPFKSLEPKHIRSLRDSMSDRPEAANQLLKLIRQVLSFAVLNDLLKHNVAKEVPYIQTGSTGFHAWTTDEVRRYESKHPIGTMARLALALLLYTGQRRGDVVGFGLQHVKEGELQFTQRKGKNRRSVTLTIPVLPVLQAVINATKTGQMVFLATLFGKPFTSNGFGNRFRKWCDDAGLPHCSAHGLRKAGATIAAENGATEHQLMAIFGWKTLKQVQHYTATARQRKLAASGMHLLVPEHWENKTVPLSEVVVQSGTKSNTK
jgi:integrase